MGAISNLLVRLGLDSSEVTAGLADLNSRLQEAGKNAASASGGFEKLGSTLSSVGTSISVGISAPLGLFSVSAIKAAGDMEALKLGLNTITGSAKETETQFKRLIDVAKLPGLGLTEAVQGSIRLQAVGISAQTSERYLRAFGNALAAVGRGRADLDAVLVQLSQMASKGKVLAQDFKPILERVPQIAKITKDLFGTVDTEQIQKLGVSSQDFIGRIVTELEKLPKTTGGINNAFENLRDSFQQALGKMGDAIVKAIPDFQGKIDALGNTAQGLADKFASLPPAVQAGIVAIGGVAIATGPTIYILGQMAQSIVALTTAAQLFQSVQLVASFNNARFALANGLVGALSLGEKAMLGLATAATIVGGAIAGWNIGKWIRDNTILGKTIDDLWHKFDPFLQKIGLTTQKLGEQTRAENDQEFASKKLAAAKTALAAATGGTTAAVTALDRAMSNLGLKSTASLNKALQESKQNLDVVAAAYRKGEASAQDYKNAQDAVAKATAALTQNQVKLQDNAGKRAQAYADANDEMLKRYEKFAENYEAGLKRVDQIDAQSAKIRLDYDQAVLRSKGETAKANEKYVENEVKITQTLGQRIGPLVGEMIADQKRLAQAFQESGADKVVTEESVARARENYQLIAESGKASAGQLLRAWVAYYDQFLKLQRETGREVTAEQQKALDDAKRKIEDLGTTTTNSVKKVSGLTTEVRTIMTDLSRGIAEAVFQMKGFGDVAKKVAVDISKAILRYAIEEGFKKLIPYLKTVLDHLGSIGKLIEKVFGIGASVPSGGSSGGSSIPGVGGGGGASGAAGALGSGLSGALTAAFTGVTAVSSIIGNFQNAHQETSLNAIEHNTRYAEIRTANIEGYVVQYMPRLNDIHQRLIEISGNTFGDERGVSQLIMNVDGRRIADALIPYIGRTIQVSVG
jgi:tape measure domain-containing protein